MPRKALGLAAICLISLASGASAQQTGAALDPTKLIYCRAGAENAPSKWETNALLGIARVNGSIKPARSIVVSRRSCGDDFPDATCFAGPGGLICRGVGIERILRAAAFLLSAWLIDGAPEYEDFQTRNERGVVDAFRAADGIGASPGADQLVERIRAEDGRPDGVRPAREEDQSLAALYRYELDRVLAVVIGHELSHVNGDTCPIARPSVSEDNKTWNEAVASHTKNDLFCDRPLVPIEVTADRCALRFLRAIDENDSSISLGKHAEAMRRLAADVVAYLGFFGLRATNPPGQLVPFRLPGYLHEPFRALLFAAEIHGKRPRPAVCGAAARIFVQAVQTTFKQCSGKGTVSDPLLGLLPPGVEKSWNGAPWTAASWTCKTVQPD
jgi:hypothetical protein